MSSESSSLLSVSRNSSRKKKKKKASSSFQIDLEHAIQMPRGIHRTLDLVRRASPLDIQSLGGGGGGGGGDSSSSSSSYSPLAGVILLVGSSYTRRRGSRIPSTLIPTIMDLIQLCYDRGISVDGGRISLCGGVIQRPLVLAAYYGFRELVEKLLDVGAIVDLPDDEGRTAWHATFLNPSGQFHVLRQCDAEIAHLFLQRGLVTSSLRDWKRRNASSSPTSSRGSIMYTNGDANNGSALLNSIRNKNYDAIKLLVRDGGAVITDRDYIVLSRKRGGIIQLENAVSKLLATTTNHNNNNNQEQQDDDAATATSPTSSSTTNNNGNNNNNNTSKRTKCWSIESDWSFPPTWKVAIQLTHYFGLPKEIFEDHVRPYLARDWFFGKEEQRFGDLPPRLEASFATTITTT